MERGERDWLNRESKLIEFIKLRRDISDFVCFVDTRHDRFTAFLQHDRNVNIVCQQSCAYVAHKQDHIRSIDSDLCLFPHLFEDDVIGFRLNTARVDHNHRFTAPFRLSIDSIARDTRRILNDGTPFADELIEKGALAHIRSADNGDHRFSHSIF